MNMARLGFCALSLWATAAVADGTLYWPYFDLSKQHRRAIAETVEPLAIEVAFLTSPDPAGAQWTFYTKRTLEITYEQARVLAAELDSLTATRPDAERLWALMVNAWTRDVRCEYVMTVRECGQIKDAIAGGKPMPPLADYPMVKQALTYVSQAGLRDFRAVLDPVLKKRRPVHFSVHD